MSMKVRDTLITRELRKEQYPGKSICICYYRSAFFIFIKQRLMKKKLFFLHILFFTVYSSFSQSVGIGTATPDNSAALDVTATNKGLLIPRMNTASLLAIPIPANGLI